MPVPAECQPIEDHIEEMEAERRDLQLELQQAATGEKAGLARQIKALNAAIAVARNQLTDCLAKQPPAPAPPPPLASTLSGTVTLATSHPQASGPFTSPIAVEALFNGERTFVAFVSVPTITTSFPTPIGPNTTTVSKAGGGSGGCSGGQMSIPVTFHFDQSIDVPLFDEDSDLAVVLSTNPPGAPVDPSGAVTLAGSGTFTGGFLAGHTGSISLTGTFSPAP